MPKKPAAPTKAKEAATALRAFWQRGTNSWATVDPDKVPKKHQYKHGQKDKLLQAEAKKLGMNYVTIMKAWAVARQYSREQIDDLCDLVVEHGSRFSATHLARLLAVTNRSDRDKLTLKAIRERWGVKEVERAIQATNRSRRKNVGKKPKIPKTEPELLTALTALCDKWTRWCDEADKKIPEEISAAVGAATRAVNKVREKATAKLSPKNQS